jgi:RHS repeat-associated protein
VKRTFNGQSTRYIYDGPSAILEYSAHGQPVANTVYGLGADEVIARNTGEGQFPLQDRLGSTVAVTGGDGTVLERYRYDAFGTPTFMDANGNVLEKGTRINNRLLFAGREWVPQFGFYENRARAYHPGLGRFMSEDSSGFGGGDSNLYRYCHNDPVNLVDPSGRNGTVTSSGNNSYRFGMTMFFHNGTGTAQNFVNYANTRLTNTFGAYQISANITIPTTTWGEMTSQNSFTFTNGTKSGYTSSTVSPVFGDYGSNEGFSDSSGGQGLSGQDLFLHELLHLLGAQDHYTGTGANRVPEKGWENNIMGGGGGNQIDDRNIKEIIDRNGLGNLGHLTHFDYIGYSFATAFSNTVNALNNYAAAHGPGIGVIMVRGPGGTQIYSFIISGYTSGHSACPGAVCGAAVGAGLYLMFMGGGQPGEGDHPVPWHLR